MSPSGKSLSTSPTKRLLELLGPTLFILIVLGPLIALLIELGQTLFAGNTAWWRILIPQGRRSVLLLRSIGLALSVSVAGLFIGFLVAMFLWRWRSGPLSIIRWILLLLVPLPPYLHALGWSAFFQKLNVLLLPSGIPQITFRGGLASWWVQVMALAPISMGLCLIGLESIDSRLIDAARILRGDLDGFKRIMVPLAAPIFLAGGALLFLLSLIDYSVPSLFQVTTYALDIFAQFSASNDPARALLSSLPLLVITFGVITLSQSALRNAALRPPWKGRPWENPPSWPRWITTLQGLALLLLIAQILVPLVSQLLLAGSLSSILSTTKAAQHEISSTWWISSLAAVLSLPISLPIAQRLLERRSVWWVLTTLPLAIPSPLIGIGLIAIWNRPATEAIYASSWMPVLASTARFAPLAAILLLTQLRRLDPTLLDAAKILQMHELHAWIRITLPLLLPGLLGTAGILFILTAGELGATILVTPPGQATLTMRIYNFLHYGASDTVAGLGLLMTLIALISGSVAILALSGWSRLSPRGME